MKRIRCPKCDEPILFDDSLYAAGRTLVFDCGSCKKQFKIKIASDINKEPRDEKTPLGYLIVIENAFHFRQEIPLYEGDNRVGRYEKGTKANASIKTVDPSVDNTHCVITVKKDKHGVCKFVLKDGPSGTGTFYMNTLLGVKERVNIEEGAVITIGATTMMLRQGEPESED